MVKCNHTLLLQLFTLLLRVDEVDEVKVVKLAGNENSYGNKKSKDQVPHTWRFQTKFFRQVLTVDGKG